MKIITRYVATTVTATTLLVVVALIGMDFFIQLVNQFGDLGKGTYSLSDAFLHVLLGLPRDLYQLFPMAGLVGCLLGLGLLASNSELIVMRTASLSVGQISGAVLLAIVLMVMIVTLLGELVAPLSTYYADKIKTEAKSGGQAISTLKGIWLREDNYFIHVELVAPNAALQGITIYQFNEQNQLEETSFAETGYYEQGQWILNNVVKSYISEKEIRTEKLFKETWSFKLSPTLLQLAKNEHEEMSLKRLYEIMEYKKNNALEYADYALPFWQRIFQPLATIVMMYLAIPFIFGPLRTVTMGLRLITGIVVGFGFYIVDKFIGPLTVVYQFPPMLAAFFPILLFGLMGYFLMLRVR